MAGAPAYRYDYDYGYETAQPRTYQAQVVPIPTRGVVQQLDPRWFVLARVILAVAIILAVAGVIRVQLTTATVDAAVQYEQVTQDINIARAAGSDLEVQAANLSNPAYVKEYAAKHLDMHAPALVETMTLGADVVAVDETGSLSLSQSLAAVAGK